MGATTALIIMGIAQAGSAIAKAKMEKNAANKATQAQTQANTQAQSLNQKLWGQQQQAMAPYQQLGGQAATTLNALMLPQGTPGAYNPAKPPVYTAPGPNTLTPFSPGLTPGGGPLSNPPQRQPSVPVPMGPGGATPRAMTGQPMNPWQLNAR